MRQEYYEIFKDLMDAYQYLWISPPIDLPIRTRSFYFGDRRQLRLVNEAIEAAMEEAPPKVKLRPDAKHFLIVNFHQMVVLPLTFTQNVPSPPAEFQDILRDDIRLIISRALEIRGHDQEITGSAVLQAIARAWEELRINRLNVWA